MSYRIQKNSETGKNEILIEGFENGIAHSPHKGIANLKNVNIATETGEVMCSFNRTQQAQTAQSTGTITGDGTSTVVITGATVLPGSWIHIITDSGTGLSGNYFYLGNNQFSATFSRSTSTAVSVSAGTATFSTYTMGSAVQSATEPYRDLANLQQYRYYILDNLGYIWVQDTQTYANIENPDWALIEVITLAGRLASGLAVLNGWLFFTLDNILYWKSTSTLATAFVGGQTIPLLTSKFHSTLVGHQGKMYYTDGNFIGSLFPNSSLLTGGANIQSYCQFSAVTTTGTVSALIGGSYPTLSNGSTTRIPVWFMTNGTKPAAITLSTTYYIKWLYSGATFEVYAASSGGSAIDIQTGAVGDQFFNTFNPDYGSAAYTLTPQRLNLPFFETAQCMAEIGNIVIIGGSTNTLYPWDQIKPLPGTVIPLPENDVANIVTVNNSAYVFAGHKGNVYITNGSSASLVTYIPDYCAGIPGTPSSYIEPYFTWGGAMYVDGRVYFSILDQTSTKIGTCGGIWSFIPSENFSQDQETGLSLRLENQSSYGTYNGMCTVLLPSQLQTAVGPQYFSAWQSNLTTYRWFAGTHSTNVSNNSGWYFGTSSVASTYGIDYSDTITTPSAVIETDIIPTGTALQKQTFSQIEYKLASPLAAGETITCSYRQNVTDAYSTIGTFIVESTTGLSGYVNVNFEKGQWLQLQLTLNPLATSSSSFVRMKQIIIR